MKLAVVGVTGLVGSKILQVLEERKFLCDELIPVASDKSKGKQIQFNDKTLTVVTEQEARSQKPDIAIFSAGGNTSLELAPKFAEIGCKVIDNSSAWRMDATKKLIVPEVNANLLTKEDMIIANPNCSTIQMVVALHPLHTKFGIDRIVVSTYQSVTGSGIKAVRQLEAERQGVHPVDMAYPYTIDLNLIPQIDAFTDNGYTKEEMKMINETRKILGHDTLRLTATTVRVPVMGGHSESVNVSFKHEINLAELREVLTQAPGVTVIDDTDKLAYPMPKYAHNKDDVFVGRVRLDFSQKNTINMWIVSDNLRKGAATNAVQIAEYLVEKQLV